MARVTGLEPATSGVTGRRSNQLSYTRALFSSVIVTVCGRLRCSLASVKRQADSFFTKIVFFAKNVEKQRGQKKLSKKSILSVIFLLRLAKVLPKECVSCYQPTVTAGD